MTRLLLALMLVVAFCCPAMAQFNVAPGGAIMPDGGLQYVAPVGAPFQVNPFVWNAYPFTWHTTPVYCLLPLCRFRQSQCLGMAQDRRASQAPSSRSSQDLSLLLRPYCISAEFCP